MCPVLSFFSETAIFSARYCVGFSSSVAHFFCLIPSVDLTSATDVQKLDDPDRLLLILMWILICFPPGAPTLLARLDLRVTRPYSIRIR